MINYAITNISSYYSYDGVFLTIAVLLVTIFGLIIETKTLNFKTLFIPIIYNIIIILCTSISVEIVTYIFSIDIATEFSMIITIGLCLYSLNFGKINQMIIKSLLFLCVFSNILFSRYHV